MAAAAIITAVAALVSAVSGLIIAWRNKGKK